MRSTLALPFCLAVALFALVGACSSDDPGPADQGAGRDAKTDAPQTVGDSNLLPWPDATVKPDLAGTTCTPEAAGMCDDDKTLQCVSGKCEPCPVNFVDCDRKDDCECFGACNGSKCVK